MSPNALNAQAFYRVSSPKNLSLITHPNIVSNLWDLGSSSEHKCIYYIKSESSQTLIYRQQGSLRLKYRAQLFKLEQIFKTRHHTLTDFVNSDKGKLGIIHYATEDHTLTDFKVVPNTTNSRRNVHLVARRRMTNENICVLKSVENIKHVEIICRALD